MNEQPSPLPVPRSIGGRLLYALVTVALPIPCFLLADLLKPDWQSGRPNDYAAILLGTSVSPYFAPFLAYAVLCLLLLLIAPRRFSCFLAVRLGIYGGFVMALQYVVLLVVALSATTVLVPIGIGLALGGTPFVVAWVSGKLQRRYGTALTLRIAAGLLIALALLVVAGLLLDLGWRIAGGVLYIAVAGAAFWCLDVAAVVSFRLLRDYELNASLSAWHVVGPLAWLGAFGVAWRMAVLRMGEVYARLPTQPPECYIATAAANGHPRLVRSWPAMAQAGRPFRANRQLQRFKLAELALQAAWPAGHRLLRRAYDALGSRLARRLRHPLLADAAYLLLKPLEWGSWAVLRTLLPQADALAVRLYAPGG